MSLTDRYRDEEEARAYYTSEDSVCARCFDDEGIRSFIQQHLVELECSVCRRKSKKPIAAPADHVLEFITDRLHRHYEDAYGNAYYDKERSDYAVTTWDMSELIYEELEGGAPYKTLEWLQEQVKDDVTYCRRNWQVMSPGEGLTFSWEQFSKAIRHETRFMFFPDETDDGGEPFFVKPGKVLDEVGRAIRRCNVITSLSSGTRIFRVRGHHAGKSYATGPELGPPAPELASTAGRMNAPGIVVAYASFEAETALAEATGEYLQWSLGEFELLQDVRVVDLTEIPSIPSIFEEGPRESLQFLNRFASDVSEPFTPDPEAHIEYTPTQVVSEYLRHRFRDKDGQGVRGILYSSAKENGTKNVALFMSADEVEGSHTQTLKRKEPLLKLIRAEERERTPSATALMKYESASLKFAKDRFGVQNEVIEGFGASMRALGSLYMELAQAADDFREGRVVLLGLLHHAHSLLVGGLQALESGNGIVWSSCFRGLIEVYGATVLIRESPRKAVNHLGHLDAGKLYGAAERGKPGFKEDLKRLHSIVHPGSRSMWSAVAPTNSETRQVNLEFGLRPVKPEDGREAVIVLANMAGLLEETLGRLSESEAVLSCGRAVMSRLGTDGAVKHKRTVAK